MSSRRFINTYLGNRCAHCELSVEEILRRFGTVSRLFELNHIDPAKKHPDYENLIRRTISSEQLDEIDKCVLLCRNCHGILHAQSSELEVMLRVKCEGHVCEQILKAQSITDFEAGTLTVLTENPVLVIPYHYQLGSKKPRLRFGKELDGGLLVKDLRDIEAHRSISVRSLDRQLLLQARLESDGQILYEQKVSCPIGAFEFTDLETSKPSLWLRNGRAITPDGKVLDSGTMRFRFCLSDYSFNEPPPPE